MLTRREFAEQLVGLGLNSWIVGQPALSLPPATNEVCDLLVKGGTVIDPARNIHAPLDIAIKSGTILEILPDIPKSRARNVLSAEGRFVTPGLIDLLVHVYEGVGPQGVNADHYCLARGVTTAVDAGSAGYPTIRGLRKYVVGTSTTRLYALIDIGALGLVAGVTGAMDNPDWVNGRLAGEAANSNKPVVVGISVRVSKDSAGIKDLEVLNRAREAAEISSLPIVVSIGDTYSPLPEILRLMRKGDVLTHCYTGQRNGLIDPNGLILSEVLEARAQGIIFDVGHGRARFSFNAAEKCLQQNFLPDTVSTDLSTWVVNSLVFDLPTTLSKFLLLGLSIDKVVGLATINPAHVFNFGLQLGTLESGAPADIAIFELREGDFVFVDSVGEKRNGRQKLISSATIRNGEIYINQSDK